MGLAMGILMATGGYQVIQTGGDEAPRLLNSAVYRSEQSAWCFGHFNHGTRAKFQRGQEVEWITEPF
jgi:hypothetical protein